MTYLLQNELAERWRMSPRTLERWRWLRQGPRYYKLHGRILYRIEDVEEFEAGNIRLGSTSAQVSR